MSKFRIKISAIILNILYRIISLFVFISFGEKKLIKLKITIGTLLVSLNPTLTFSQKENSTVYSINDTLRVNISLKDKDVHITCYVTIPDFVLTKEPQFKGGELALKDYLKNNLRYPPKALKKRVKGVVEVEFIIDEKGNVKDAKVIKGISYECDKESIRLIQSLPQFQNGWKEGKPVEYKKEIFVEFKLPEH